MFAAESESFIVDDQPEYDAFEFDVCALLLTVCSLLLLNLPLNLFLVLLLNLNLFLTLLSMHS